MNPILNIAIYAIRKGGEIILQKYDNYKNDNKNQVHHTIFFKNIIYKIQQSIHKIILKFFSSNVTIYNKFEKYNKKDIEWKIYPIHGKKNFINNFPYFCTSITIYVKKIIEFVVIYDPIQNELFTITRSQGIQLNGYKIKCNKMFDAHNTILSINISTHHTMRYYIFDTIIKKFFFSDYVVRYTGCIMLDVIYLCIGRIDYIIDFNDKNDLFDICKLSVQESGGLIQILSNITQYNIPGRLYSNSIQDLQNIKDFLRKKY